MNVQTGTGNTLFHLMIFRKILVYLRNEMLTDARNDTGGSFPTKIQLAICFLYTYKLKFSGIKRPKTAAGVLLLPLFDACCFRLLLLLFKFRICRNGAYRVLAYHIDLGVTQKSQLTYKIAAFSRRTGENADRLDAVNKINKAEQRSFIIYFVYKHAGLIVYIGKALILRQFFSGSIWFERIITAVTRPGSPTLSFAASIILTQCGCAVMQATTLLLVLLSDILTHFLSIEYTISYLLYHIPDQKTNT